MANDRYLKEKLTEARDILATHQGTITERLQPAFLRFAPIMVEDVGEAYRCEYEKIMLALLADGNIETTLNGMDNADAVEVARSILKLLSKLEQDQT